MATMSLIQLLMGQQQHAPTQAMSTAVLQRQQQKTVNSNPPANNAPKDSNGRSISVSGGAHRTHVTNHSVGSGIPTSIHAPLKKQPLRQWTKPASIIPQVKRTNKSVSGKSTSRTLVQPSPSAKRAAFLNKRSKATGPAYRNPNKKQRRTGSNVSAALVMKNRKKNEAAKLSSSLSLHKHGGTAIVNAFTLNEDFKENAISDLLFPWKLHDMLDDAELNQDIKSNVVSWQADGVSFNIHDKDRFVQEVVPKYFQKIPKEWDVFLNILSSWGFVRFTSGTQKGAFIHRLLVRGKRSICKQMRIDGKTVSKTEAISYNLEEISNLHLTFVFYNYLFRFRIG